MFEIILNNSNNVPLYQQVVEQIKYGIANNLLKSGESMPTIRKLASLLKVNPATVARAYQELSKEQILTTIRRRGTVVVGETDSSERTTLRQNQLAGIVNKLILEGLSTGYNPDELEASFTLNLARWRIQRVSEENEMTSQSVSSDKNINIVGSNDLALDLLVKRLKYEEPEITINITTAGSLGGLLAIQAGTADMAGVHLLDEESGEYNYPYIKHILPGIPVVVVHLADRIQGFVVPKGNPKGIRSLEDFGRSDVTIINRQKGSGTRVWLDHKLRELGINPANIKGYESERDTHMGVAIHILKGEADTGLGILGAAKACNLDFIPVTKEKFDLVVPQEKHNGSWFTSLVKIICSEEFKKVVNELGGYDTAQTGNIRTIK